MAATVRSPGARIAPIKSTLAHSHTCSLKTASKWRNTCIIPFGRVSISSFSFGRILKEAYSAFPFLSSDWIKSTLHGTHNSRFRRCLHNIPLVGVVDCWLDCWLPGNQIRKNPLPPLWDYRHYRGWPRRRISCRAGDKPLASQYHAWFLCHDNCRFPGGFRPPGNRALCRRVRSTFENEFVGPTQLYSTTQPLQNVQHL